ncbi:Chromosome (plasmid) partitioning protein ParB [hydrothermal vent metagenome]|uniref:Chromosome (Plasmid) partitioning protein ParB n=1 Tax=hydrothermal vent metagenome TaxID=652676 RepID=A0A3B1E6U7_9ZZZZ
MQSNKLGKGLGELLGEIEGGGLLDEDNKSLALIDISDISVNPYQPRKYFDDSKLQELAQSIREHGLLQPILVVKTNDIYILIAGERRLRATKLNGDSEIKALVLDYEISYIKELSLIENIQREDLNAIEIAKSYNELIEEYKITHEELANKVKKSRSTITNSIRLLQLPSWIQDKISSKELSAGQSKMLIGLEPKEQKKLVDIIIKDNLPSSQVEQLVKELKNEKTSNSTSSKSTKKQIPNTNNSKNTKIDKILLASKILDNKNIKSSILDNKIIITFDDDKQIDDFLDLIKI